MAQYIHGVLQSKLDQTKWTKIQKQLCDNDRG